MIRALPAGLGLVAAASLLAGCADKGAPTRTYVPSAAGAAPSPAYQAAPPVAPDQRSAASGLRGQDAIAAANRDLVEPDGDQMRGAVWSVPDASCDEPYHLYVADRTATTVMFPPGETFQKIIPPNRDLYAYSVSDAGERVAVSLSPQGRQRTATLNVATDRCVYLFTVDTTSDARALRALELNRPERHRASAPSAPLPDGAVTQLHFAAANGQQPPPWMPARLRRSLQDRGLHGARGWPVADAADADGRRPGRASDPVPPRHRRRPAVPGHVPQDDGVPPGPAARRRGGQRGRAVR